MNPEGPVTVLVSTAKIPSTLLNTCTGHSGTTYVVEGRLSRFADDAGGEPRQAGLIG